MRSPNVYKVFLRSLFSPKRFLAILLIATAFSAEAQIVHTCTGDSVISKATNQGTNTTADADYSDVIYDETNNRFMVVWRERHQSGGLDDVHYEVYGRWLNGFNGAFTSDTFKISDFDVSNDTSATAPAVAYGNGAYLVVWADNRVGATEQYVFGQFVNATTGASIGSNFQVSEGIDGQGVADAKDVEVTYNETEQEFLVVWDDGRESSGNDESDVWGQLIDGVTRTKIGADFRISNTSSVGNGKQVFKSAVVWNATDKEYLVVWQDDQAVSYTHLTLPTIVRG